MAVARERGVGGQLGGVAEVEDHGVGVGEQGGQEAGAYVACGAGEEDAHCGGVEIGGICLMGFLVAIVCYACRW